MTRILSDNVERTTNRHQLLRANCHTTSPRQLAVRLPWIVASGFSSLFPEARVSALAGSVNVRTDFILRSWRSQRRFFIGLEVVEPVAVPV